MSAELIIGMILAVGAIIIALVVAMPFVAAIFYKSLKSN